MKVTVESASTSETEDTEDLDDATHHPNLAKSLDKIKITKYQQLQVRSMFCALNSTKQFISIKPCFIQKIMVEVIIREGYLNNF